MTDDAPLRLTRLGTLHVTVLRYLDALDSLAEFNRLARDIGVTSPELTATHDRALAALRACAVDLSTPAPFPDALRSLLVGLHKLQSAGPCCEEGERRLEILRTALQEALSP